MKKIERKTVTLDGEYKKCPKCDSVMHAVEIYGKDNELLGAVYECNKCGLRCPYCDVKIEKFNVVKGRQILSSNKKETLGEKKVIKCNKCGTVQGVVGLFFDTLFPNLKKYEEKMRFNMRLAPVGLGLGLIFGGLRASLYSKMSNEISFLILLISILFFMISAWGAINWAYYSVKMAGVRNRRLHSTIILNYEVEKGYILDRKYEFVDKEVKDICGKEIAGKREVKVEL